MIGKLNLNWGALLVLLSVTAYGQIEPQPKSSLAADTGNNNVSVQNAAPDRYELFPQLSVITPSTFVTDNGSFKVPYSENFDGLPSVSLAIARPVLRAGNFQFLGQLRVGFARRAGLFKLVNQIGERNRDNITLNWVPMSLSTRVFYEIPGINFLKPTLTVGMGSHWISQGGNLKGISSDFLIPYFFVTPAITLLEGRWRDESFAGITFGLSYYSSLSPKQTLKGTAFELGFHFLL